MRNRQEAPRSPSSSQQVPQYLAMQALKGIHRDLSHFNKKTRENLALPRSIRDVKPMQPYTTPESNFVKLFAPHTYGSNPAMYTLQTDSGVLRTALPDSEDLSPILGTEKVYLGVDKIALDPAVLLRIVQLSGLVEQIRLNQD